MNYWEFRGWLVNDEDLFVDTSSIREFNVKKKYLNNDLSALEQMINQLLLDMFPLKITPGIFQALLDNDIEEIYDDLTGEYRKIPQLFPQNDGEFVPVNNQNCSPVKINNMKSLTLHTAEG